MSVWHDGTIESWTPPPGCVRARRRLYQTRRPLTQELARDPIAFGAKEKRLLGTLKDLDAKLESLNKDRDTALKK